MKVQKETVYDRLTSRHIAKLLTRLGSTIAPVTASEIKRQMRYLTEDIISVNTEESENAKEDSPQQFRNVSSMV